MLPAIDGIGGTGVANVAKSVAAPAATTDFGSLLQSLATETSASLTRAEQVSVSALEGKASARELVDSVMSAEQTLQTALAFRDKTVAALQEITRMSI